MIARAKKRVLILAGPNGAGKTTFAREFLPDEAQCQIFVNADLIAAGLSPFNPAAAAMRAGRLMVQIIAEHIARGESLAFETTLADKGYARHIPHWQARGYHVSLVFLALPSAGIAIQRVSERVAQGGHFVPDAVVRRRFASGRSNFEQVYKSLVNAWALYDNSGPEPVLLDWGDKQ
jgi:predicted ABC-type ATPase